jgi:Response regulator containing CheY-like receiver domain and AraC-type DNA-binding domain
MWKVLIADDEPKIRRGLSSLVGRCGDDLSVVAEAEDGEAAYEAALAHDPDILLIDVRMPIKGGLELVESLNKALPGKIIIIVSGHDEFEYAQAAVKLQVFDYVLKPVDAASFSSVLARARSELEARRDAGKYVAWARAQVERNLPVLRERFLRDWVSGSLSRAEIAQAIQLLDLTLSSPATLFGARISERGAEGPGGAFGGSEESRRLAIVAMRSILEGALPAGSSYVFEDDTETILALSPGLGAEELASIVTCIEWRAAEKMGRTPALATRSVPEPTVGLYDAYEELCAELAEGDNCEAFVVLARNFIDKHYWNADLCLEDAAAELQISPGYLSRLMKRETGFSFVEYLNRVRVKKAATLMSDPAAKAFEVAERVGYRSQHYFSRAFKKVTGSSPTDYKKGPSAQ